MISKQGVAPAARAFPDLVRIEDEVLAQNRDGLTLRLETVPDLSR